MKIYIAGSISGSPNYLDTFTSWANCLEDQGHLVLNPAALPPGMEPADYMRICFSMIDSADHVLFLPQWERSFGAALELDWCKYTGKPFSFSTELDMGPERGDFHA